MAIVYLITNLENGKRYVGKTKGRLDKRWYEHTKSAANGSKHAIHCAIRLYGTESFTRTILGEYATEEEALSAEISWIDKFGTLGSTGYNMCEGGRGTIGYHHSAEAKEEMRAIAIAKGQRPSPLALQRSADLRRGQPRSEETKARQAAAQAARREANPATDEFRERCRVAAVDRWAHETPRVLSDEERARRSTSSKAAAPKRWATRIANVEKNDAPRLSIGEAAKRIGRSVAVLCKWDRDGRLQARRTDRGHRYYDAAELEAALATFTFPKAGRPPQTKD